MSEKVIIIDGYSLANRAFFALPPLATAEGQPTNAVYGLLMMILKLMEDSKPDYLLTAFDVAAPTLRRLEYPQYKANRMKMEESLRSQFPLIRKMFEILNIPIYEKSGFEADDLIGTISKHAAALGLEVMIVTGDRDSFQLVEPHIKVLYTKKGISDYDLVDEAYIQNRYQLTPEQLIDLKGLMGDVSDNIPGVPGVGEKTALKYLHQFGSVETLYEHLDQLTRQRERNLFETHRDQAFLSKHLATIDQHVDIAWKLDQCSRNRGYDRKTLIDFCREYQFKNLLTRLSGDSESMEVRQLPELEEEPTLITTENLEEACATLAREEACGIQIFTSVAGWRDARWLGLGLCASQRIWFYPLTPEESLPEQLVRVLSDPAILKYGHDLKRQMLILSKYHIELLGSLEDLMLAGYLINAGMGRLDLEDLTVIYLGKTVPVLKNSKGAPVNHFEYPEDIPREDLLRIAGGRLAGMRLLRERFATLLVEQGLNDLYYQVELPLIRVLFEMEKTGVALDPDVLRSYGHELREAQRQLETAIYQAAGMEFNISSPKQLGAVLFERLGLHPPKKNKTGYATDATVLESLAHAHPVIPLILEYRQNVKLQSTYIESLIALIHPETGRVHTTFNQAVTTTGRLSSTEPNLQNIPTRSEAGRMIRRAFIPQDDRHLLLSADYSQIELRVMAHFSQDVAYREAFLHGGDIHKYTAAAVWGIPLDEVTREMRDQAKAVNFGIIYGISGFGLAQNIGVSRKAADEFIQAYFRQYPGVKAYVDQLITTARETGEARTILGRIRKLPDLTSRSFTLRSFAERMAMNTPIQGTAADIIKVAMVRLGESLQSRSDLGKLILQVHDELIFEVPKENWWELARIAKHEMEQAIQLTVPLVVDFKLGSDWSSLSPVHLEE